jgi:uncharacterized membrane protein (DUF4010 family)
VVGAAKHERNRQPIVPAVLGLRCSGWIVWRDPNGADMDFPDVLSRLALALGIGLLIGLERGWRTREAEAGSRAAGIRTFAISGLLGNTAGAIATASGGVASVGGGILLAVAFATYAAVITTFCRDENRADQTFSATTAVAAILTFALGAYSAVGDIRIATAAGVATAGVLAAREELHGWVKKLAWPELRSGLVLLAMTFVALPVVPDERIGPLGGVNPREVWLIAIALAGVSFVGYVAVKYYGASRGVLLAAVAGGLVSSTAVTISSARRAAAGEGSPRLLAAGVALASAVMFLRVSAIIIVLNPGLLVLAGPALGGASVIAIGFAAIGAMERGRDTGEQSDTRFLNPFGFWMVVGFAALLAVIIVFGRIVGESFGATGAIIGAVAVGLADVDSVAVSMTRLTPEPLGAESTAFAILAAVASNTVGKIAIGVMVGRGRFALLIAAMALACLIAGVAALAATLVVARS